MKEELAKKLKDRGYPQKEANTVWKGITPAGNREPYYSPSLSELVEACGDSFGGMLRTVDNWNDDTEEIETKFEAFSSEYAPHQIMFQNGQSYTAYSGDTSEEAVANLWLALKTK